MVLVLRTTATTTMNRTRAPTVSIPRALFGLAATATATKKEAGKAKKNLPLSWITWKLAED